MKTPVFFIGEKLTTKTRNWLARQQVQFIEQPFFKTEYKRPDLEFFGSKKGIRKQWIVTSIFSAYWLIRFKSKLSINITDRIYCRTEKQAEILSVLSLPVFVSQLAGQLEIAQKVISQNENEIVVLITGDENKQEFESLFSQTKIEFFAIKAFSNSQVKKFVSGFFDAYLFFSAGGIDGFKASGNFPHPTSIILANENSTARAAWKVFTNKVLLSPDTEELSFVQFSIAKWIEENNNRNNYHYFYDI